ncbi:hypothetical protein ACHAPT_004664 [Fusarium lateritium]
MSYPGMPGTAQGIRLPQNEAVLAPMGISYHDILLDEAMKKLNDIHVTLDKLHATSNVAPGDLGDLPSADIVYMLDLKHEMINDHEMIKDETRNAMVSCRAQSNPDAKTSQYADTIPAQAKIGEMTPHIPLLDLSRMLRGLLDPLEKSLDRLKAKVELIKCTHDHMSDDSGPEAECDSNVAPGAECHKKVGPKANSDNKDEEDFEMVEAEHVTGKATKPTAQRPECAWVHEITTQDGVIHPFPIQFQGPMIIVNNLPSNITYTQVLEGVTGLGGIRCVRVRPQIAASRPGAYCAAVRFKSPTSAEAYINFVREKPIFFQDSDGDLHKAQFLYYKAAAPSRGEQVQVPVPVPVRPTLSGRCLDFGNFPVTAIWDALRAIGLLSITRASFNPNNSGDVGDLSVEFISVFHAQRARRVALQQLRVPGFSGLASDIEDALCDSDYPPIHIEERYHNVIPYVKANHLANTWNRLPYNTWTTHEAIKPKASTEDQSQASRLQSPEEAALLVLRQLNMAQGHVLTMELDGIQYSSAGGNVFESAAGDVLNATRIQGRKLKQLQDRTIADPSWTAFWRHFLNEENALRVEDYAKMAKHRHLVQQSNIACAESCDYCSPRLHDSPVPLRVRMYNLMTDDGYFHADWLRNDDAEVIRSIPSMHPKAGSIIHSTPPMHPKAASLIRSLQAL